MWNSTAIQCFKDEAQALLDLIPKLNEDFDKAINLILSCKGKVIITGVGKSGHIGAKIAATLSSTGTPSFYVNPLDLYHGDLGVIMEGDVVIAISNSGYTDELLRLVPSLNERNISIIGMSGNPDSLLAKNSYAHLNIAVEHEADPLNLAPTSSTTATLAMGDAIACCLVKARGFREMDFAQFHPGGMLGKRLLTKASDVMHTHYYAILQDGSIGYFVTDEPETDDDGNSIGYTPRKNGYGAKDESIHIINASVADKVALNPEWKPFEFVEEEP
jgi:arabinose-5-phosphate isomerase